MIFSDHFETAPFFVSLFELVKMSGIPTGCPMVLVDCFKLIKQLTIHMNYILIIHIVIY